MALIEILVSAMLLIIVAVGVFAAFDATTRATGQERHRARANALAQADLERIRSLPIACPTSNPSCTYSVASLVNPQSRNVTQDAFTYTIVSSAEFVTEPATTNTCAAGTGSRDYLRISSRVTWPTMGNTQVPTAASLVTPPSGSVVPNSGSLLVQVDNAAGGGIQGVALTGSGAGSFSGTTGPSGCVLWRNLPAGNYTMSIGGAASGLVDRDGDSPEPEAVSVVSQSTNTVNLVYDDPGGISPITFRTRDYSNTLITASADSVIAFNSGMSSARRFGTPGTPSGSLQATGLFPFTSPYSVYAGLCANNNPGAGAGLASVTVPAGGTQAPAAPLQIPAVHLTVRNGSSSSNPGNPVPNARVRVEDMGCQNVPTTGFKRSLGATNASGQLASPGLPHSTYQICADLDFVFDGQNFTVRNYVRSGSSIENVPVQNLSAGTVRTIYLGGSGAALGTCPT